MANRPYEHIKAQKEGKRRDNNACLICGTGHNVEGHHIVAVKDGGAADPNNIVALCKEHHKLVHQGKIDIDTF